jgi:mannose-6-phosphate isomerase
LAALRRTELGTHRPEEWLGSTVVRLGHETNGLTQIDGVDLRDIIGDDPESWLGAEHVARYGPQTGVLVKLLDAGQRLPVHLHPTRRFARQHLDCPYGKTEAWVVLEGEHGGGTVFVGTTRPVPGDEWADLVERQAVDDMLALLNPIKVWPGDAVVVPSGTPHAIGADTFVLEVQEPTDLSILLEWDGFDIDGASEGHLGLGFETAINAIRPGALEPAELELLTRRRTADTPGLSRPIMPPAADPYFRAWRLDADPNCDVPRGLGVLLVTNGHGSLTTSAVTLPVTAGDAFVIPHAAACTLTGSVGAYLAQPPAPDAPRPTEWDE